MAKRTTKKPEPKAVAADLPAIAKESLPPEVAKAVAKVDAISEQLKTTGLMRLEAPAVYAQQVYLLTFSNDATVVFVRPHPVAGPEGLKHAVSEPVAIVQMSMATLKDFVIAASELVAKAEEKFGVIETDYTIRKAQEAKTAAATKKRPAH